MERFRGLPVYWESANGRGIIVYDRSAFKNKYKLFINKSGKFVYEQSNDFLGMLLKYAKKNYYISKADAL